MITTGKIAFITGAGKGIGLETARRLGNRGVHLVLGVRKQAQGEAALETLRSEGSVADLLGLELDDA